MSACAFFYEMERSSAKRQKDAGEYTKIWWRTHAFLAKAVNKSNWSAKNFPLTLVNNFPEKFRFETNRFDKVFQKVNRLVSL